MSNNTFELQKKAQNCASLINHRFIQRQWNQFIRPFTTPCARAVCIYRSGGFQQPTSVYYTLNAFPSLWGLKRKVRLKRHVRLHSLRSHLIPTLQLRRELNYIRAFSLVQTQVSVGGPAPLTYIAHEKTKTEIDCSWWRWLRGPVFSLPPSIGTAGVTKRNSCHSRESHKYPSAVLCRHAYTRCSAHM